MSPIKKGNFALAKEPDSPDVQDDDEIEEERNSGSDEEDEDEEENPEELADFIVGDDFEEEEGEDEAPPIQDDDEEGGRIEEEEDDRHERRKKHRKKKKDIELDEDDLELIQENEGNEGRHHKKLKKTKEIAKSRYDYDDELVKEGSIGEGQNDFIEQDEAEEAEEERYRPRRSAKRGDNSALFSIFGGGYEPEPDDDYGDERGMQEEDDLPEEDRRAMLKKKYELMFDPGELQDKFATFADEQIVAEDVPERLQLRYKGRFCDNNELVLETNWIGDKLMLSKGLMDKNSENFRKNIMKVLEFLRINFFEVKFEFWSSR